MQNVHEIVIKFINVVFGNVDGGPLENQLQLKGYPLETYLIMETFIQTSNNTIKI